MYEFAPRAKIIWEITIVCLAVLFFAVLLFDSYIFFGKIQQLQNATYDTSAMNPLEDIKRGPLNQMRSLLESRANALKHSGDNLPEKNPFQP